MTDIRAELERVTGLTQKPKETALAYSRRLYQAADKKRDGLSGPARAWMEIGDTVRQAGDKFTWAEDDLEWAEGDGEPLFKTEEDLQRVLKENERIDRKLKENKQC